MVKWKRGSLHRGQLSPLSLISCLYCPSSRLLSSLRLLTVGSPKRNVESNLAVSLISSLRSSKTWLFSLKRRSFNARLQSCQVYSRPLSVVVPLVHLTVVSLVEKINRTAASNTSSSYPTNHQSRQRHTPYPTKWHAPVPNARASSKKVPGNRNRSLVLDNRIKNSSVPPTSSSTAPMTTQSPTPHAGSSTSTPALMSTSTTPNTTPVLTSAQPTPAKTADSLPKTTYVHHTTKKGNMSLVKPEIYGKL